MGQAIIVPMKAALYNQMQDSFLSNASEDGNILVLHIYVA